MNFDSRGYVNPKDGTSKEKWLDQHGKPITVTEALAHFDGPNAETHWPVCLVTNPGFTAAGIAPIKEEAEIFADRADLRPKKWFLVPRELLEPFMETSDE